MLGIGFWLIQVPGWLLVGYLVFAQCASAVSYAFGVRMGTQEPSDRITEVGVAMFKGYAGADLVFYTPLLAIGLLGHAMAMEWSDAVLGAGLGVTVYWPIACLWTVMAARGAPGWSLPKERDYWIVLPLITLWGLGGLILLVVG